ncbi:PcfK-like family protein [Flavobacterium sp. CSZ]|uniref:PcfK-like family protein n=1 Tax=Flavobacterium sp. CSZ TaxID=2783791 RepID=UPI00188B3A6B|nr:PcfK-like family protein [Flavobacterium sp. CSZ]MBF4484410.1 PcfK-like family protein [Flavobacterium sp. CSZ]
MKTSKEFKEAIQNYLEKRAAEDELFAVTYKKENKSLEECCNYIMNCAQSGGCGGYSDNEVFGWAVHYYDEDDIKNIKSVSGKVIVNHSVELSEEDKAKAVEQGMERAIEEAKLQAKKNLAGKVKLSEEDKREAKQIAFQKVVSDQKEKLIMKKTKKKESGVVEDETDLFSGL